MLYVHRSSSIVWNQFFVLNLVGWFGLLSNKFIIPLLYYYINVKIINSFLSFLWRYISFFKYFFIIVICNYLWIILCELFETLIVLLTILLPIRSRVALAVFWMTVFESAANLLAWLRGFWLFYQLSSYLCFYQYFYPYF